MILQFDTRYSIGSVYIRYGDDRTPSWESWQWLSQAIGPVEVPEGARVHLRFGLRDFPAWRVWSAPTDQEPGIQKHPDVAYPESILSSLRTIDPHPVEGIDLRAISFGASGPMNLSWLTRFDHLKSLELGRPYNNGNHLKAPPSLDTLDVIFDEEGDDDF